MSHPSGPPRPVDPRTFRGPSPEEAVDTATHRQALRRCMGQLNSDLRDIMRCRYAMSMSSREIAQKFSRTAQAVDAIVYRLKKLLSDCIKTRLVEDAT